MIPIYFPDTHVPDPILGAMLACFKQITMYQPARNLIPESLRRLESEGLLEIHCPEKEDPDPLPDLLKSYYAWAELHQGERPDFETFRPPHAPYCGEDSSVEIHAEVRRAARGDKGGMPSREDLAGDSLLKARLFLAIAQEYDQHRQALSSALNTVGAMEQDLFRNLSPDQEEVLPIGHAIDTADMPSSSPPHMSSRRLAAWCRLYAPSRRQDATPPGTRPLFITGDHEALDLLLETAAPPEVVCCISGVPFTGKRPASGETLFHKKLLETLKKILAVRPVASPGAISFPGTGSPSKNTGTLTIYRIPGDPMARFISRSKDCPPASQEVCQSGVDGQCTLIGGIIKNQLE